MLRFSLFVGPVDYISSLYMYMYIQPIVQAVSNKQLNLVWLPINYLLVPSTGVEYVDNGGNVPGREEIEDLGAVAQQTLDDIEDAVCVAGQGQLLHELTEPLLRRKHTTVSMVTTDHGSCVYVYVCARVCI